MNVLGVVHARGGSKRIPLKNIKTLGGRPLIAHIIGAALAAETIDRLIVSTDHEGIAQASREAGAEVPFMRPADIAEDVASELVTQHAVRWVEEDEGRPVDVVVTFQPTTPFCTAEDVDGCVRLVTESDADSAMSVGAVHERPEWMLRLGEDGYSTNFLGMTIQGDVGISQTLPPLYIPNGGIWVTRRKVLFEQNVIVGPRNRVWVMPRERSVDIDDPIDFELAEFMAQRRSGPA